MTGFSTLKKTFFVLFFGAVFISAPSLALSATLYFDPQNQNLGLNQEFGVDLMIEVKEQEINAVAASIVFPADLIEIKKTEDAGSILSLWVDRPYLENGVLSFAGLIPGGFQGHSGKLLTLRARALKEGTGEFVLQDIQVLLHDGQGTPADFSSFSFQFSIREDVKVQPAEPAADTIPPEPFVPEIAKHPDFMIP